LFAATVISDVFTEQINDGDDDETKNQKRLNVKSFS